MHGNHAADQCWGGGSGGGGGGGGGGGRGRVEGVRVDVNEELKFV